MIPLQRRNVLVASIFLIWLNIAAAGTELCPLGFKLTYRTKDEPICYRLKGPELFTDKFRDCAGNLYSSELYHELDFPKPNNVVLWSEHRSLYPGGPFIDWSLTDETGKLLKTTNDVKYGPAFSIDDELCVVIDPVSNFTATKCNEMHHRYCFVSPYPVEEEMSHEGCEESLDYWRFWSPRSTCLTRVSGVGGGTVRATWEQAQELCSKRGGTILHRGWRYANSPVLHQAGRNWIDPLGIFMTSSDTVLWMTEEDNNVTVPDSEWSFKDEVFSTETSWVALYEDTWHLVNSSYIFFDVICEKSIPLKGISMDVADVENRLILSVNETIHEDEVKCFSDSETYYPVRTRLKCKSNSSCVIDSRKDGYYWCININSKTYHVTESNKALFIKDKSSLFNFYAVKVRLKNRYSYSHLQEISKVWEKKLNEYIFYRTLYMRRVGEIKISNPHKIQGMLEDFRRSSNLDWKDKEIIKAMKIKRVFLDAKTALLHIHLSSDMEPLVQGAWEGLEVVYMKPVFYCKGFGSVSTLHLGQSTTVNCRKYSCVGDFNEGVQWITTAVEECASRMSVVVESDIKVANDIIVTVTNASATTTAAKAVQSPDEQLQQVLHNLDQLLQNDSIPVVIETINEAFDEVDILLETERDLEIPAQFLHLLDRLAAKADLNGSQVAAAVRQNIAMVMADAGPDLPVKGLRIASRNEDIFREDAFEIVTQYVNSSLLMTNESEAVVHFPESISSIQRRISFVIFRNDRAFHSNHGLYSLNSRVLSVNVENLTEFENSEVIDIHFRPTTNDPNRNTSRVCAYWHFIDNVTGYWSQEGCTFIRASQTDMLDICRCVHLTHFAEILVPRSVFSQRNEDILEVISIVGCCSSIIGLALIAITAILFRSWRRDFTNKVWLQLCLAIFILAICFLVIVFVKFDEYNVGCMLTGVLLHYSVLTSFCWMLVAAVLSYRRLVLVFTRDASHKLLRASAFSWGAPCAVVGILLSVAPHSYAGRFEEKTPSGAFCYPSGLSLWLTVYAPVALILLANWTLFGLIVRSVFASRRIQRHGDSNEALRCASVSCLLVFLFGLPWLFGLFATNIFAAYLFTLTATFQGFVLFIFFVVGNKKTRELWLNKLKIKQTRRVPVTSSTYTNKSSGAGWRGESGGASSMAKSSKPRSLSSQDDSKFS